MSGIGLFAGHPRAQRFGAGSSNLFSVLLAIVFFSGLYIFRIRKRLFDRDPEVTGDHYGARNLRLWQVILVWILAMDLLIMALWKL